MMACLKFCKLGVEIGAVAVVLLRLTELQRVPICRGGDADHVHASLHGLLDQTG